MNKSQSLPENNPLACPQREISGSLTFENFEYQYHWALCRLLEAHENSDDYVLFMELHEDVVFSTSIDLQKAKFEFTQVKNIKGTKCTAKKLVRVESSKKTNSILGKMLLGIKDKKFHSQLKTLDLVVTCGFNLKLKQDKTNYNLTTITLYDIDEVCLQEIQESINKELGDYILPKFLRFIEPELSPKNFQETSKGKINNLVDKLFPEKRFSPNTIYRVLIDDMHRKGTIRINYENWEEMILNKGITQSQVQEIILTNTDFDKEIYNNDFEDIVSELNLKIQDKIKIRREFQEYMNMTIYKRALDTVETKRGILNLIDKNFHIFENNSVRNFIDAILQDLPKGIKNNFNTETEILAAIIYELINKIYGKKAYNR